MFEEFYEMYEPEEQEVVALINRCIGGGFNWKGNFWEMTVVTLGMVFCDTGKVTTKEERLEWPVTDEERNSEKGWGRFQNEQICRLKIRRMKEEWAKDLEACPCWYALCWGWWSPSPSRICRCWPSSCPRCPT